MKALGYQAARPHTRKGSKPYSNKNGYSSLKYEKAKKKLATLPTKILRIIFKKRLRSDLNPKLLTTFLKKQNSFMIFLRSKIELYVFSIVSLGTFRLLRLSTLGKTVESFREALAKLKWMFRKRVSRGSFSSCPAWIDLLSLRRYPKENTRP